MSHAEFINAYLRSIGAEPVNLDNFRLIESPRSPGCARSAADQSHRPHGQHQLLPALPEHQEPGLRRPLRPDRDHQRPTRHPDLQQRRRPGAGRHRPGGGVPLRLGRARRHQPLRPVRPLISSREVLRIVSSIYATEAIHYAIFRDSLNGITAFQNGATWSCPTSPKANRARPMSSPSAANS